MAGAAGRNGLPAPELAPASGHLRRVRRATPPVHPRRGRRLEPMTGLEPVTSSLPRTRSTTELHRLVPARAGHCRTGGRPIRRGRACSPGPSCRYWSGRRGSNPRPTAWKAVTLPLSYSRFPPRSACTRRGALARRNRRADRPRNRFRPGGSPCCVTRRTRRAPRAPGGGEGRIRTSEAARATDLQSVAFDRSATSPIRTARPPAPRPAGSRQERSLGFPGLGNRASRAHSNRRPPPRSSVRTLRLIVELAKGFEPPTG